MKLASYSIFNYKSARNVHISLDDAVVRTFIGVNDCGKSTLLHALKAFFEDKPIVFESGSSKKTLLSNSPLSSIEFNKFLTLNGLAEFNIFDEKKILILCKFQLESQLTVDQLEKYSAQLQCILAKLKVGGFIHILKVFSVENMKGDYYILGEDFLDENSEPSELWIQNQTTIKSAQKSYEISNSDVENRNNAGIPKNIELILAIHEKAILFATWSKFDYKKDVSLFPVFKFLDWNIGSDEINQLTEQAIRPIINELVAPIEASLLAGSDSINTEANKKLKALYDTYSKYLPESITGISTNVKVSLQPSVTELFVEKNTADKKIHIDEQGDGIRRQIGLGLIRAIAVESLDEKDNEIKYIWCFDEPETHLYPEAQRILASSLNLLAKSSFQVLVSTHSTMFVDKSTLSSISRVQLDNFYTTVETTTITDDIHESLGVRNSDFLFYDRFIAVEGATEYGLMDHMYQLIYETTLSQDGIQLINLGGASNSDVCSSLLKDIFLDFKKIDDMTIYAFDRDTAKSGKNVVLVGDVADFEDEISDEVWIRAVSDDCGIVIDKEKLSELRALISTTDANKKFWNILNRYISAETKAVQTLSAKGQALAVLLKSHITDEKDVPNSIKEIFNLARKVLTAS
jgi:putative ATP-dependent endonuclease of OLD family